MIAHGIFHLLMIDCFELMTTLCLNQKEKLHALRLIDYPKWKEH